MENTQRVYLKRGQTIALSVRPDGSAPEQYRIQSVIGEGGSAVCYEAIRERDNQIGRLKEFYPVDVTNGDQCWYYSLERLENGQLIPTGGTVRKFGEMCEDYLKTYSLLNHVIAENPHNQILKNFIQIGEVLYGTFETVNKNTSFLSKLRKKKKDLVSVERASVYIWSLGIAGKGFDEYLSEIRSNPSKKADYRLHDILATVLTLTDCIKSLHTAGLLHLDMKPSNFLVPYDSESGLNTGSISMFDVNTLYSVFSEAPRTLGTEGYRAPEIFKGRADNRSDIYSIGAILFYALVVTDDIPDGIYRDSYYDEIDQLVKNSKLLAGSESITDVLLMSRLANILKKCLAKNPKNRYDSCSQLKADLERAEIRAKQYATSTKVVGRNKKLAIIDTDVRGLTDPVIVMQKLLHDHPLFENLEPGQSQINVLVVGSGTYGQKFMDLCLQAGQMKGRHLRITSISNNPEEDQESYLQFRPAFSHFVNVCGSMSGREADAYGTVVFQALLDRKAEDGAGDLEFNRGRGAKEENRKIVKEIVEEAMGKDIIYDYIFVALGRDDLNRQIASFFSEEVGCPVCYVSEKVRRPVKKDLGKMLYPVFVNEEITPQTISPQLEQMAFNADICWNSSLNLDIADTFSKFCKDAYRYSSSLAYALSIRYKLYSIGIAIKSDLKSPEKFADFSLVHDLEEAAEVFSRQILEQMDCNPEAKKKFDTLVALEHRRWVLSMVTEGWSAPLDEKGQLKLETCILEGKVKNEPKRTHPCIVFSTEATPLKGKEYTSDARKKWDDPKIDDTLDELDRMSVELHQRFRVQAEEFKRSNPLQSNDMLRIWELINQSKDESVRMFQQFQFCLKNILNGVESYTRQYDYYETSFLDSLGSLPADIRSQIKERLALIRKDFFPVVEANLYRDYKENDEILVKKIPFILSYHFQSRMAMAFEDGRLQNGRNEAVFADVASATVLSPKEIYYLYCFGRDSDVNQIAKKIPSILNYLGKRKVHCSVTFTVGCLKEVSDEKRNALQKMLELLKKNNAQPGPNAVFADYEIFDCASHIEVMGKMISFLKDKKVSLYDGSTHLFPSILDSGSFAKKVVSEGIPYFEFDWRRKVFNKHIGCDYLQFIEDDSSIRINDMFALMNARDTRFNLPEFADDYEALWDIYTGNQFPQKKFENGVGSWNRLCIALEKYEAGQKPLAVLRLPGEASKNKKEIVYILPEYTFGTVKYLLSKLVEYGIADKGSSLSAYTTENCKLMLFADPSLEQEFNKVFLQPQNLLGFYGIKIEKSYNGKSVIVSYNNMKVTDVNLDADGKGKQKDSYDVLKKLEEGRFIKQLAQNPNDPRLVSFEYSSARIKKLLTSAGEILEVYTYYQALKTGYFDDVACGYEFCWEDGEVKNELDVVLTKGFRSIIVECKAVQKLELDFYHKLHSIADQFGIGTIKVLVGNTYRHDNSGINSTNRMQRNRGDQLSIKTISNEQKIKNIGESLIELMEG